LLVDDQILVGDSGSQADQAHPNPDFFGVDKGFIDSKTPRPCGTSDSGGIHENPRKKFGSSSKVVAGREVEEQK